MWKLEFLFWWIPQTRNWVVVWKVSPQMQRFPPEHMALSQELLGDDGG